MNLNNYDGTVAANGRVKDTDACQTQGQVCSMDMQYVKEGMLVDILTNDGVRVQNFSSDTSNACSGCSLEKPCIGDGGECSAKNEANACPTGTAECHQEVHRFICSSGRSCMALNLENATLRIRKRIDALKASASDPGKLQERVKEMEAACATLPGCAYNHAENECEHFHWKAIWPELSNFEFLNHQKKGSHYCDNVDQVHTSVNEDITVHRMCVQNKRKRVNCVNTEDGMEDCTTEVMEDCQYEPGDPGGCWHHVQVPPTRKGGVGEVTFKDGKKQYNFECSPVGRRNTLDAGHTCRLQDLYSPNCKKGKGDCAKICEVDPAQPLRGCWHKDPPPPVSTCSSWSCQYPEHLCTVVPEAVLRVRSAREGGRGIAVKGGGHDAAGVDEAGATRPEPTKSQKLLIRLCLSLSSA